MSEQDKERKFPRVHKLLFTEVTSFDDNGEAVMPSLGRTLNISEGGMLLEVPKGIPFQMRVNVSLGFEDDVVKMEGNMVHLRKTDNGAMEMGIEFTGPTDEQLELIHRAMLPSVK